MNATTTMPPSGERSLMVRRFAMAWLALAAALALHVTDEALTDFLSVYNPTVLAIREHISWLLIPTFTFGVWITGLAIMIALLFLLSPFAFRGRRWIVLLSVPFSVLMVGNGLLHIGASFYKSKLMPGVISSPLLIATSTTVLIYALRLVRRKNCPSRQP